MSLKPLMTHEDGAKYRKWLASHSTAWLTAYKARLEGHPDYYNGYTVKDRINEVTTVLEDRAEAEEETA